MKLKKRQIQEIIDSNDDLIGTDDTPKNGTDLESQANNTTDYNAKVGHQPYRYDMLGRFGFTLLPFFEGKEDSNPDDLLDDLAKFLYEKYMETLEYYYRNPQKLKSDFRKKSKLSFEEDDSNEIDYQMAEKILDIVKPHFEGAIQELDKRLKKDISEGAFIEGKMLNKKDRKGVVDKTKDKEVIDKRTKKIADLINKLDKDDVKKIKNLLETD